MDCDSGIRDGGDRLDGPGAGSRRSAGTGALPRTWQQPAPGSAAYARQSRLRAARTPRPATATSSTSTCPPETAGPGPSSCGRAGRPGWPTPASALAGEPRTPAEPGRLCGRGRLDPLQLPGAVPRPTARHQGSDPLAAGQCGALRPRSESHRHHRRQLRRLDGRDGGGDRRRAGDGRRRSGPRVSRARCRRRWPSIRRPTS